LIRVGVAGWAIPRALADDFPAAGSRLERYARRLGAVEINSSFYRPHRRATYARWADSVPESFRFSVKVPRTLTHERRLADPTPLLEAFLEEIGELGPKLGAVLVQLPPSLAFNPPIARDFLDVLRARFSGFIALEPRHKSWFGAEADALLVDHRVARVAADPAVAPQGGEPGGWRGGAYLRLHGSPRMYYSPYGPARLEGVAARLRAQGDGETWCIFDNTALGAATADALTLRDRLSR
jgi:uncharacterized protein YecE (DUF72 family)